MIDIGVNLINSQFHGQEKKIVDNAFNEGVKGIIFTGTTVKSIQGSYDFIQQFYPERCALTSGMHPHNAKDWKEQRHIVKSYAKKDKVIAVGECGLDYDRMYSTKAEQHYAFEEQLAFALELNKPVFLHLRPHYENDTDTAMQDFKKIITPYIEQGLKGVVHCFTGNRSMLDTILDMDLYIGITGWVSDPKRGTELKELIPFIPDNRLLIETDSPYLKPKHVKAIKSTRINEPAYLKYIAQYLADLKKTDIQTLSELTNDNVYNLFKWNPVL